MRVDGRSLSCVPSYAYCGDVSVHDFMTKGSAFGCARLSSFDMPCQRSKMEVNSAKVCHKLAMSPDSLSSTSGVFCAVHSQTIAPDGLPPVDDVVTGRIDIAWYFLTIDSMVELSSRVTGAREGVGGQINSRSTSTVSRPIAGNEYTSSHFLKLLESSVYILTAYFDLPCPFLLCHRRK